MNRTAPAALAALLAMPALCPGQHRGVAPEPNPVRAAAADRPTASEIAGTRPPEVDAPLTSYPYAYQAWLRRKIASDLVQLDRVTGELVASLDPAATGDRRAASKRAGRVVKLSHNIWSNLQMRRPTRERPTRDALAPPRGLAEARADAHVARALVEELAGQILDELRSKTVDMKRRLATLELLERIERIGLQVKLDVARNRER